MEQKQGKPTQEQRMTVVSAAREDENVGSDILDMEREVLESIETELASCSTEKVGCIACALGIRHCK